MCNRSLNKDVCNASANTLHMENFLLRQIRSKNLILLSIIAKRIKTSTNETKLLLNFLAMCEKYTNFAYFIPHAMEIQR